MTTALEGMRVLELSVSMSGSMAGMFLTENGAEVIKVEPPGGDPTRGSAGFLVRNRGKKSIVIDLKTAGGVEQLKQLAATADGVIEDFAPDVADRLGVGYDALREVNPSLVYASITAFGEHGPYRDLPGYEPIVAAKTGRMISQEGFREGRSTPPRRSRPTAPPPSPSKDCSPRSTPARPPASVSASTSATSLRSPPTTWAASSTGCTPTPTTAPPSASCPWPS